MNCPKCQSNNNNKNGFISGRQRYFCKLCQYNYSVPQRGKPKELRKMALILYLEGLGFRSIERILNISHVTVMNWVKRYGEKLEELKSEKSLYIEEMDEIHTYIGSKKIIVGYGLLLTDLEKDSSSVFLVQEGLKQAKNYGKKLKKSK